MAVYDQSWFLELPTVCRSFKFVFDSYPELQGLLVLDSDFDKDNLSFLQQWVTKRCKSLKHFVAATDSPTRDQILDLLQRHTNNLTAISLRHVTQHSMTLLSAFVSITYCTLCEPSEGLLSLQGLCQLSHLTDLTLEMCEVSDLDAAKHLTYLQMFCCSGICSQPASCASSLLHLELVSSSVSHFDPRGIAGCSSLQSLQFGNSSMDAYDPDEGFHLIDDTVCEPSNLSRLTALTELTLDFRNEAQVPVLHIVSQLKFLQALNVEVMGSANKFRLPVCLSVLHHLSVLSVHMFGSTCGVDLQFNWAALARLHTVTLCAAVEVDGGLRNLASLSTLRQLNISHPVPMVDEWTEFAKWLGTCRPKVELTFSFK